MPLKDIDCSVHQLSLPKEALIYPYCDEKNVQNGQYVNRIRKWNISVLSRINGKGNSLVIWVPCTPSFYFIKFKSQKDFNAISID